MEESIKLIRQLWAGPTSHDGEYLSFPMVDLEPKPVQDPCPIWIASNPDPSKLSPERYERAIERVSRLADGWMSTVVTPEDFGTRWDEIRQRADSLGRGADALTSAVHLMINLQEDETAAHREAKSFLDEYYVTDTRPEVMDAWGVYGTAERIAERVEEYRSRGVEIPILRFASFDQKGQLERALEELLPGLAA
jgi:alkanesulfonate monooxygenase SsuD/methylene tetrahydromethanopterin reductase-like flavin-dependent oxidoreductase (luciferase family)